MKLAFILFVFFWLVPTTYQAHLPFSRRVLKCSENYVFLVMEALWLMKKETKMEQAGTCTFQSPRKMCILHLHLNSRKDGSGIAPPNLLSFI